MRKRIFRKVRCFMRRKELLVPLSASLCFCFVCIVFFGNTSCSDEDEYLYWKAPTTDMPFLEIETTVDLSTVSTVQDIAGHDLELIKLLFPSCASVLLVGDPRQVWASHLVIFTKRKRICLK